MMSVRTYEGSDPSLKFCFTVSCNFFNQESKRVLRKFCVFIIIDFESLNLNGDYYTLLT